MHVFMHIVDTNIWLDSYHLIEVQASIYSIHMYNHDHPIGIY